MHESSTRDYERMCEIGQEILGATRQTRRLAKAARGGVIRAALEAFLRRLKGLHRQERTYEGCTRVP